MKKFNRRSFIRSGLAWGGIAFAGSYFVPGFLRAGTLQVKPDIYVTDGDDPMKSVNKLLDAMGGMQKFVSKGDVVGLLVNSPWRNPGYFTHPDVALAVARACLDAGAKEIVCYKPVNEGYWEKSRYFDDMQEVISKFSYGSTRIRVPIPLGIQLKEAEIFTVFNDVDKFINIPVAKHHNGVNYSGCLKGMMGVSSSDTNRHMHSPDGEYTYAKQEYLSQCIADLNLLRKPDLCVVDAIECAVSNGPQGPGNTVHTNKIICSTDPVAADAYASTLIGFETADIPSIGMAAKHGLGKDKVKDLEVMEV